ncbi:MAG: transcription antitermination factor NusB [Nocardioidaceae bacterium]
MSSRSKARKRALDILFESELRGLGAGATLDERQAAAQAPLNDYTVRLVEGVAAHLDEIDATLSTYSAGWTLERMPAVDRNILRIGVFELTWVEETPSAVALNEAVAMARELSTDESPAFVNGLLARVASVPQSGRAQ